MLEVDFVESKAAQRHIIHPGEGLFIGQVATH